ncbi:MAG: hypothetical protein AAF927_18885 [Bacteroidota bacterium]
MRISFRNCLLCSITFLLLWGCGPNTVKTVFYQWETRPDWSNSTQAYLDTLATEQLFLRFFDIEWDDSRKRIVPIGSLRAALGEWEGKEVVPVVYLSENVLSHLNEARIADLAELSIDRIRRIAEPLDQINEIQIDSDWSAETQANYFAFIEQMQTLLGETGPQVSVCVYPHHVLQRDSMGIPPVARARLMLMEIDDPVAIEASGTLFGANIREAVSEADDYGVPLDVGLPIGSWGVVLRNEEAVSILRHLPLNVLEDRDRFEVVNAYFYRVLTDTYLDGTFLFENDMIRLEALSPDQLRESVKPLAPYLSQDSMSVGFFHLEVNTSAEYPPKEIERLVELFR